jgi:type III secretion protein I
MEIAALSSNLVTQVVPAAEPARAAPTDLTTERFNAIMNAPEAPQLTGVSAALQSAFAPTPPDAVPTLGNQILSGLRSVSNDLSDKWRGLANGLDSIGTRPAVSDMLRVQTQLLQVSVQYEMVGKVVSRSTQNIDTLVRMS